MHQELQYFFLIYICLVTTVFKWSFHFRMISCIWEVPCLMEFPNIFEMLALCYELVHPCWPKKKTEEYQCLKQAILFWSALVLNLTFSFKKEKPQPLGRPHLKLSTYEKIHYESTTAKKGRHWKAITEREIFFMQNPGFEPWLVAFPLENLPQCYLHIETFPLVHTLFLNLHPFCFTTVIFVLFVC
jgi:hypothetical protein